MCHCACMNADLCLPLDLPLGVWEQGSLDFWRAAKNLIISILLQKFCISMSKHNKHLQEKAIYSQVCQDVASWIPAYRRWWPDVLKRGQRILVYFLNDCPWKYGNSGDKINTKFVMDEAQKWANCFDFAASADESHIRVKFHGKRLSLYKPVQGIMFS